MNKTMWSENDLNILNTYYKDIGAIGCKEKGLTKSLGDIRRKAYELGIEYKNAKFEWGNGDLSILKEYYSIGGAKLCIEKGLNKSEQAINTKAKRMSLMYNPNKWQDFEVALLKEYYLKGGLSLCKEKGLNRNTDSIRKKAKSLGLYYKNLGRGWSTIELELLNKYYKYGVNCVIEKGVNRSIPAIQQKARDLGLSVTEVIKETKKIERVDSWSTEELNILKEYYPKGGVKLCQERGLNRNKNAIYSKASDENISIDNSWSDGECNVLKNNYPKGGYKLCQEKGIYRSKDAIDKKAIELGIKEPFNRNLWSEEELVILRDYYPKGGSKLCIEKGLKRSKGAIMGKANTLNIKCTLRIRSKRSIDWSIEEDEVVQKYYLKGGVKLCQQNGLSRTEGAIKHRARYLGIRANKKEVQTLTRGDIWSEKEYDLLKEYYPKGGSRLCKENGLNKSEGAIRRKASSLNIEYSDYKPNVLNVWTEDEIELLKKYYKKGGYVLCQEKGLNRTKVSIKSKAKQFFPDYVRERKLKQNDSPYAWTVNEVKLLKKYYPLGGYKLCQQEGLNRSRGGIIAKAQEYRLYVKDIQCVIDLREDTWDDDEIEILKKYYPLGGVILCQREGLNRTRDSIVSKAINIGLTTGVDYDISLYRDDLWSEEEVALLKEYYPKGGALMCQHKGLNRGLDAIKSKAHLLSLNVEDMYYIKASMDNVWKQYEIDILKEYYPDGGSLLCQEKGLKRDTTSISSKARLMGVTYKNSSKANKWLDEELNILKNYFPIGGVSLCNKKGLNRTDNAIVTKARRLGLKYNK